MGNYDPEGFIFFTFLFIFYLFCFSFLIIYYICDVIVLGIDLVMNCNLWRKVL